MYCEYLCIVFIPPTVFGSLISHRTFKTSIYSSITSKGLRVKLEKCEWVSKVIKKLDFKLTQASVQIDDQEVEKILG